MTKKFEEKGYFQGKTSKLRKSMFLVAKENKDITLKKAMCKHAEENPFAPAHVFYCVNISV